MHLVRNNWPAPNRVVIITIQTSAAQAFLQVVIMKDDSAEEKHS